MGLPSKPLHPCNRPGCRNLTRERFCPDCAAKVRKAADEQRGSSSERGYGSQWQKARKRYLTEHPLCVECEKAGQVTAATIVDHKIPHKGDYYLFWDENNWQSLCKPHHDAKSAREDGGFGR